MIVLTALLLAVVPLEEDTSFLDGRRLYEASEYEQAIFRFQEAALVADRAPADRAQVLVWLGLAYAGFGDAAAARRAFGDAIRLDRAIASPIEISPKVMDEIEAVRAQVAEEGAPPPPAPAPAPPPVVPDDGRVTWGLVAGLGTLGAICVVAGAVATGFAVVNDGIVKDLETFQDDAARAQDDRDAQVGAAVMLYGIGTVLIGGGGVLLATGMPE